MIVAMKKITFLMKSQWAHEAIDLIKEAGVLHVSHSTVPAGENMALLESKIDSLEKVIAILERVESIEAGNISGELKLEELIVQIMDLNEEGHELEQELEKLESEYDDSLAWGEFDPRHIKELETAGISLILFSCPQEGLKGLPADLNWQVINRIDGTCYVALFTRGEEAQIPFRKIAIPLRSFRETEQLIDEKKERLHSVKSKLSELARTLPLMKEHLKVLRENFEFEQVCAGMGAEEGISYVKGFVPHFQVEIMKKLALKEHWGILVEEPKEEDEVPTLITHSRLSALFQPVMSFIGITPGYFEYDTNAVFIIFFSLFFAMIVGDAGYGLLLLFATFGFEKIKPSLLGQMKKLFYLLSLSTLVWGALSGNWFGSVNIGTLPFFKSMVLPGLDSFNEASSTMVMELCFLVALLHLSVAHIWKGILVYPSLKVLGEGGWLIMLAGIYLLVKGLILKSASIPLAMNLVFFGFVIIILFGKQGQGSFLKGVLSGLKSLPVTALDGVGGLSNIVSYLRLFAVGMASKEVAAAFNGMAFEAGFHDALSIVIAALILVFGHGVNMLLIAMSVIVHGIRLNILEYSGHMNIEWSGIPYKPFGQMAKGKNEKPLSKELMEV